MITKRAYAEVVRPQGHCVVGRVISPGPGDHLVSAGPHRRLAFDEVVCVWTRAYLERVNAATRAREPDTRPVRRVLAVDGKAMRATRHGTFPMHLLAALDQTAGVVVAKVSVDVKTNEIPLFSTLLDQIPDLDGVLVTADALHAQVAHLDYLRGRGAHLLVCVKGNQPKLRARLAAQPWKDIPVGHTESGRGHGRIEKRTLKVVTVAAGLGLPHPAQAIQIVRRSRPIRPGTTKRARWRKETVYAICTLSATVGQPRELAHGLRGHWGVENRLHWVRDVTLGEDLHQARTGSGPHALAVCRNLAISLLRFADHTNIARALRHHADHAIALVINQNSTTQ